MMRRRQTFVAALAFTTITALMLPSLAGAWGANAHRLITNKAIDTLPAEMRGFYEGNRVRMLAMVTDPLDALAKNPAEKKFHVLYLNRYSPFPFDSLPRNYKKAVAKFGLSKVEANGVLPWQIGVYNEKLTDAFRRQNWDEVRQYSTLLAHYVAEAQDPFNTADFTETRAALAGADERFDTNLVDRYSLFFPMRPNDAHYIGDPTDTAFEDCFSSHSWLQIILLADRRSRAGLPDFTDEYYDRFYNQAGAVVIRQLSDAATEVGSYWLTAWTNAGKPALPQH
jgi:hypothetical protein